MTAARLGQDHRTFVTILISLLLQHGSSPAEIGHALRRAPDGSPAILIGAAIDQLQAMERAP